MVLPAGGALGMVSWDERTSGDRFSCNQDARAAMHHEKDARQLL
jgi:hypothetical protein